MFALKTTILPILCALLENTTEKTIFGSRATLKNSYWRPFWFSLNLRSKKIFHDHFPTKTSRCPQRCAVLRRCTVRAPRQFRRCTWSTFPAESWRSRSSGTCTSICWCNTENYTVQDRTCSKQRPCWWRKTETRNRIENTRCVFWKENLTSLTITLFAGSTSSQVSHLVRTTTRWKILN